MDLASSVVGHRSEEEDEKRDKVANIEARSVLDGVKSGGGDKKTTHEEEGEVMVVNANGEVAVDKSGVGDLASSRKAALTTTKGKGLRKWRRIKRETTKEEGTLGVDPDRKLKRGLSNSESASKPPRHVDEEKPKSDDAEAAESSVASASAIAADQFRKLELPVLDPYLEILVTETGFSLGCCDSDNSEDRGSSKSSTAVSGLQPRLEFGLRRERSRGRGGHGGMGQGGLVLLQQQQQRGMRGRVGGDASKKSRPDRFVHGGRDLSWSSAESEVRSSNAVVVQVGSTSSNGEHSRGGSVNCDGEGARFRGEDSGDGFCRENGEGTEGEVEEGNHEKKREENDSFRPQDDRFLEPLGLLQAAQEALEREVQRFEEFENELQSEESEVISSPSLLSNLDSGGLVKEHVKSTLPKASVLAQSTESKDPDHGAATGVRRSLGKGFEGTCPPQYQDKLDEMELHLEDTLKSKLELEIECVHLCRKIEHWKVAMEDQREHSKEQNSILADHEKLTARLSDSERHAAALEAQARELQASRQKLVQNDEALTLKNTALCLLMQLVMLFVSFSFVVIHLIPSSCDYVPT